MFVPLLVYFLAKKAPAAGCLFFVIMGKLERTQRMRSNAWPCLGFMDYQSVSV